MAPDQLATPNRPDLLTITTVGQANESDMWGTLRRRVRDRLPHRGDHHRVALLARPMIVTGPVDTVPGLGVDGQF